MPNKLLYSWRGDYCKCVRSAQLPVLTEVRALSLLEQHPWYVPHRYRAGYNRITWCQIQKLEGKKNTQHYNKWQIDLKLQASNNWNTIHISDITLLSLWLWKKITKFHIKRKAFMHYKRLKYETQQVEKMEPHYTCR